MAKMAIFEVFWPFSCVLIYMRSEFSFEAYPPDTQKLHHNELTRDVAFWEKYNGNLHMSVLQTGMCQIKKLGKFGVNVCEF